VWTHAVPGQACGSTASVCPGVCAPRAWACLPESRPALCWLHRRGTCPGGLGCPQC
jgi:hypothetical protein